MQRIMKYMVGLVVWTLSLSALAQIYVTPKLGGGQAAENMVHIDIYYDQGANELHAIVDDSYGTPQLRALAPGYTFDPLAAYAVLNGKAYNAQYGWNPGGFFTIPAGAAIWIKQTNCTPGLEVYADSGRFGSYAPIFGTSNSSPLWTWSGAMVHNTYAVSNSPTRRLFADYHIYFGDANTGARGGWEQYDDAFVRLEWTTVPVEDPLTFKFGAFALTNASSLCFLNATNFVTNSAFVINLRETNSSSAVRYERSIPMLALAASSRYGGPETNHAALGSCLELEFQAFYGKPGAQLTFWEPGQTLPGFSVAAGTDNGTNRIRLSESGGGPNTDPYGCIVGRRFSVDQPGLYRLGFRVVDASTNGPAHGPIHQPSTNYWVYLQAGHTINSLSRQGTATTACFGGASNTTYFLERAAFLNSNQWVTVAGPMAGTNRLQSLTDTNPSATKGFYRLRVQ